jgi:transcription factor CP2 and related proteins
MLDNNSMATSMNEYGVPIKRQRITPPLSERVMLYVRQDNEDVYTALHVVPPTTNGLISAVSETFVFVAFKNVFFSDLI